MNECKINSCIIITYNIHTEGKNTYVGRGVTCIAQLDNKRAKT